MTIIQKIMQISKNKGTFFSSKLKVEEKKVPLFFWLEAPGLRYGNFIIFMITKTQSRTKKMRKWPYLSPGASNPKNKGTFFSSTFKVEENKVPLFFGLEAPGLRYGHFVYLTHFPPIGPMGVWGDARTSTSQVYRGLKLFVTCLYDKM